MKLAFDDWDFDGQLQRSVAKADWGMSNPGECLQIASSIEEGDEGSWHASFAGFADGLRAQAGAALAAGHAATARGRFLRACEYYRNAFFYHRADLDDSTLQDSYAASRDCFHAALPLLEHPIEFLEFSGADGATYSGYLIRPAMANGPRPVVVMPGGYDGTAEESYPMLVEAAKRGYAALSFDGPGQGATLYERRIPMRPDWEMVLPPVIDSILALPDVDERQIVLLGRSFGGYLAPRAASGEQRLARMILDPGQYDIGAALIDKLPQQLYDAIDDDSANESFQALLKAPGMQRLLAPRMATHGCATVQQYARELRKYTVAGRTDGIACPTLVCDNETDPVSMGQGKALLDRLNCPKDFIRFRAAQGADGHCEGMAATVFFEHAFDWLDESLDADRA